MQHAPNWPGGRPAGRWRERCGPSCTAGGGREAPPLAAAAYNAGGLHPPREGDANLWRLRSTGDHISRLCQFFGDACAVAAEEGWSHVERVA